MKLLELLRITHKRLMSKSPAYFRVFTIITCLAGVIVALPEFLSMFNIQLPAAFEPHVSWAVSAALWFGGFVAALTVEDPTKISKPKS